MTQAPALRVANLRDQKFRVIRAPRRAVLMASKMRTGSPSSDVFAILCGLLPAVLRLPARNTPPQTGPKPQRPRREGS